MSETKSTDTTTTTDDTTTTITEETVPKAQFDSMAKELAKFRSGFTELETKLKQRDLDSLKTGQKWEEVAKLKEQESEASKSELNEWKKSVMFDKKISAIREEAIKQKIRAEALDDLEGYDFGEMVQVEATKNESGIRRINVVGAKLAVEHLKQKRAHWFEDGKSPNVATATTTTVTTSAGKIDGKAVADAYAKYQKSRDPKDLQAYETMAKEAMKLKQQARQH